MCIVQPNCKAVSWKEHQNGTTECALANSADLEFDIDEEWNTICKERCKFVSLKRKFT